MRMACKILRATVDFFLKKFDCELVNDAYQPGKFGHLRHVFPTCVIVASY